MLGLLEDIVANVGKSRAVAGIEAKFSYFVIQNKNIDIRFYALLE